MRYTELGRTYTHTHADRRSRYDRKIRLKKEKEKEVTAMGLEEYNVRVHWFAVLMISNHVGETKIR